jgi:hypothetical protein
MSSATKSTIGQAIDQTLSALSTLEKREQQIVVSTICSLLDLTPSPQRPAQPATHISAPAPVAPPHPVTARPQDAEKAAGQHRQASQEVAVTHGMDIRSLKNQKQPANVIQMACVAAFYLQEHAPEEEKTREVTGADLERLFKQAGFKLPSRMQQVLPDAKAAGYFESIDRGKYKLTRVGYNLVTHSLPKAAAA